MNWINNTLDSALKIATQKVKQKQFLWMVSAIFLIAFGYHLYNNNIHPYLLTTSLISLGLSFIVSKVAFPFLYIWMIIGSVLSEISSTIILAIIYFSAFLPIKLFKFEKQTKSGWIKTNSETNFNEQF
jgi:hypothetical protein